MSHICRSNLNHRAGDKTTMRWEFTSPRKLLCPPEDPLLWWLTSAVSAQDLLDPWLEKGYTQCWKKKVDVLVAQSCLTLCDPMDYSLPGSSVHGILQAKILEWVAISFSRWSSWPRDPHHISCITGRFFTVWDTREDPILDTVLPKMCLVEH